MSLMHFHFLRHAGLYHYILEDIPHAVVGWVHLNEGTKQSADINLFGLSANTIVTVNVVWSLANILFGGFLRVMQIFLLSTATRERPVFAPAEHSRELLPQNGAH